MNQKIKVLFVCLGNICRSPAAEGAFTHLIKTKNLSEKFHIDSSGTGNYHIGDLPHINTRKIAQEKGIELTHRARQFSSADFNDFDYILAMDQTNYNDILSMAKTEEDKKKVYKFRYFEKNVPGEPDVPDPYFGGIDGFKNVQNIVYRAAQGFLEHVREVHKL